MAAERQSVVQTSIDADIKDRAGRVLEGAGISIPEALRIFLTRTAEEGAVPFDLSAESDEHDAWFRGQVEQALNDPASPVDDEDVRARFALLRSDARTRRDSRGS